MLTLDTIVRNKLFNAGKPMHWYLQYLNHAKDVLRELNFDMLKSVNTKIIPLTSYKAAPFPAGYVDFTLIGTPIGQYVRPLLRYNKISDLNNYDGQGNKTLYGTDIVDEYTLLPNFTMTGASWFYMDQGRWYGYGTGRETDVFKEIRARREFQLDEHYPYSHIYLQYITDGTDCDSATEVHPYAQKTIEAYIDWMVIMSNRNVSLSEKREGERLFTKERDTLAARLSDITVEDMKRVYRRAYYGATKN